MDRLIRHIGWALLGALIQSAFGSEPPLQVLSSKPQAVTGGNVLVQVGSTHERAWTASLNGTDVTALFREDAKAVHSVALIDGLRDGLNVLELKEGGLTLGRVEVLNHPLSGPMLSGVHQQPFVCQTIENGLGPPLDAECNAETQIQYYYKSRRPGRAVQAALTEPVPGRLAPGFKAYDLHAPTPSDVAWTSVEGRTRPYVVRREVGTINRAVYDIEFLHQPGEPVPTPWSPTRAGWNGRIVFLTDGGCGAGYHQGTLWGSVGSTGEPFLAAGYAVVTTTLNISANDCNDRIAAETLSMVKEHFIKEYGVPVHTIGWGSSGGAWKQYLIVQNYPGLLDGIIPESSFPDLYSSTLQSATDCALLGQYFKDSTLIWTDDQKTAVSGFASWSTCSEGWSDGQGHPWAGLDPRENRPAVVPRQAIYEPTLNSTGVRCDLYTNEINVLGKNPHTGRANRPLDNVGVQYGLIALKKGEIDAEQFLDLNQRIGGFSDDGKIISTRTVADPQAVTTAYRQGLVLTGGGGLSEVPIIDERVYDDDEANQHDKFRSFVTRARLVAANGSADNQIIVIYPRESQMEFLRFMSSYRIEQQFPERALDLVRHMDRWLDAIAADDSTRTPSDKVARNKPADLSDGCWATDGKHIVEPAIYRGNGECEGLYPSHADPRIVAGGPLTDDVLKCVLKPVQLRDYLRRLTARQLKRLKGIFPAGVCDYRRLALGKVFTTATWQSY